MKQINFETYKKMKECIQISSYEAAKVLCTRMGLNYNKMLRKYGK